MDTASPTDKPSGMASAMPAAAPEGERWVTLRELADIRGISQHSATRLVRRHRWRRQTDNQGRVRALVPLEALDRPADKPGARPPDMPSAGPIPIAELKTALESLAVLLRQQIQATTRRAEEAEKRADRAEAARDGERSRADALRDRIAEAEARQDRLRAEVDSARAELADLRKADAARRGRGRLGRLRAAWRGE